MKPGLEVVHIGKDESFKAWEHGYPYHTIRWHFHPEMEIHHVVATSGRYFVGDFIGEFGPGNLVLTGPNLPHNWLSDLPEGTELDLRNRVLQFPEELLHRISDVFPEAGGFSALFNLSQRGALFSPKTSEHVGPILAELVHARGPRRVSLFLELLSLLATDQGAVALASNTYVPDPSGFMTAGVNKALAYINQHLTEDFGEVDLAATAGMTTAAFSRSFRKQTGLGVVEYVNRLRINLACQMLMNDKNMSITNVCYSTGFNNLSNFNRQFLRLKSMPPTRFRALMEENTSEAA